MNADAGNDRPLIRPEDRMHRRLSATLRVGSSLHDRGFPRLGLAVDAVNRLAFGADIPVRAGVPYYVTFMHNGLGTVIDEHVRFEGPALVYQHVTLGYAVRLSDDGVPTIGSHVVIGAGATVVGNITIGSGVFIGAGTVVNFDVPDDHVVSAARAQMRPMPGSAARSYWSG